MCFLLVHIQTLEVSLLQQQLEDFLAKQLEEVVHGIFTILSLLGLDVIGGHVLGLQVPILPFLLLPLLPVLLLGRLTSGNLWQVQVRLHPIITRLPHLFISTLVTAARVICK